MEDMESLTIKPFSAVERTKITKTYEMDFKDIVKANVTALTLNAFLVPEFAVVQNRIIYGIRFLLYVVGTYSTQIISEMSNLIIVSAAGNIPEIVSASYLALCHALSVPKVLYLYLYKDRVKNLINSLNRPEFQPKTEHQQNILKHYIKVSKFITYSFWAAGVATCVFWGIYPFTEEELRLPLTGWFPFDTTESPIFECAYVYQFIASNLNGLSNITMDTLMSGLIMAVSAQLSILNDSLINIGQSAELEVGHEFRNDINSTDEISPQLQERMNKKLIECIIHHRYILKFVEEFQYLFSNSIFAQFIVSVIILCTTMFEMTQAPFGSVKFFSVVIYQYCILLEIFLWCYYGNEVILKSTMLRESAYKSAWIFTSKEYRKNLVFFMTRSQQNTTIFAGGFVSLSLGTFVTIVKSAWSYFAGLKSVNN